MMLWTLLLLQAPLESGPTVDVGGRMHLDFAFPSGDSGMDAGAEIRRARIRVFGDLAQDVEYMMEVDFAGGDAARQDSYLRFTSLGPGDLTIGDLDEPFGLSAMTSTKHGLFLERSLPTKSLFADRGLGVQYGVADARRTAILGWFRPTTDGGGPDPASPEDYDLAARFVWRPWFRGEGEELLHLGASAWRRDVDLAFSVAQRPGYHLGDKLVSTGPIAADAATALGVDLAWQSGRFHADAEYVRTAVSATAGADPTLSGWSAQAGWFVAGGLRGYSLANGAWDRVRLGGATSALTEGCGAWELAVRLSEIDLDEAGGGTLETASLAVNWYLDARTRLMLNWIRSDADGIEDDILALRLGIDW